MSSMEAWPPLGTSSAALAFLLTHSDISGQKARKYLSQSIPRPSFLALTSPSTRAARQAHTWPGTSGQD